VIYVITVYLIIDLKYQHEMEILQFEHKHEQVDGGNECYCNYKTIMVYYLKLSHIMEDHLFSV